jgi:predicted DNA-binding ribbon-helix-helix protein
MGRPKGDRDDQTVKLDRGIVEKAKFVAMRRKTTMAQLMSEILRAPIEKLYRAEVKNLTSDKTN